MTTILTINSKQYYLSGRNYTHIDSPLVAIKRGLTGLSIVQDFAPDEKLSIQILCYKDSNAPKASYGTISDLRTAFITRPVKILNLITSEEDWLFTGQLDLSLVYSLVDDTVPFIVPLALTKYYPESGGGP